LAVSIQRVPVEYEQLGVAFRNQIDVATTGMNSRFIGGTGRQQQHTANNGSTEE